jgi:hypothetical protein
MVQGGPMRCPLCRGRGSIETGRDYPSLPVLGGGGPASARPMAFLQAGARLPMPMPPEADGG